MGKYFGTDGVRGVANKDLTPDLAFRLGRAGAYVLSRETPHPRIVIGKDTRISGDMLEAALIAGITSVGADVLRVGVLPTPAIAYLTRHLEASAGVVISASHNPVQDNGIKFFAGTGFKLPDEVEEEIEAHLEDRAEDLPRPTGVELGRVIEVPDAEDVYIEFLQKQVKTSFAGIRIVYDGANGAAYHVAPKVLRALGAEVIEIFCQPDGANINAGCGSTHPEALQQAVVEEKADLGLANDGDADRLLAVDAAGNLVDGDQIMVMLALALKAKGKLPKDTVVVTVMSNLGLHQALSKAGIRIVETKVGDRYVLEGLLKEGAVFGGEQSGHILNLDYNTTGDGVMTALQVVQTMVESKRTLAELAGQMVRLPQLLVNVRVKDKKRWETDAAVQEAIRQGLARLAGRGRILVRPSGTESLVRVMAEGPDQEELEEVVGSIAGLMEKH